MPRIEISLDKIQHNTQFLCHLYKQRGISLMGVSKGVLGDPLVAKAMVQGGVKFIADSRLENIQKMRKAGIPTPFVLLRTALSQAESIVRSADISLNTELETIKELSYYAQAQQKTHLIIIMVELGDLREGILPKDLSQFVAKTLSFPFIKIIGIGCNLACYGGVKPDETKMQELSALAERIETEFSLKLALISGGNSANHEWYQSAKTVERINNLRLGELILLGRETINRKAISGLYTNAFQLIAEVIEAKEKPSLPYGEIGQDAFGDVPHFLDRGIHQRIIIALGRQDIGVSGLRLSYHFTVLGSSSDHLILHSQHDHLKVGNEVNFNLNYGGLLSAMTSPFIKKNYITNTKGFYENLITLP